MLGRGRLDPGLTETMPKRGPQSVNKRSALGQKRTLAVHYKVSIKNTFKCRFSVPKISFFRGWPSTAGTSARKGNTHEPRNKSSDHCIKQRVRWDHSGGRDGWELGAKSPTSRTGQ